MRITVTGAAGQIGYALLFRIASGAMLGSGTRVDLRLLELPAAARAAEGIAMELQDCAFPELASVDVFDDAVDGGELMHRTVHFHGGDCGAFKRAEEDAAERVANRVTVAGFKRLGDEFGVKWCGG